MSMSTGRDDRRCKGKCKLKRTASPSLGDEVTGGLGDKFKKETLAVFAGKTCSVTSRKREFNTLPNKKLGGGEKRIAVHQHGEKGEHCQGAGQKGRSFRRVDLEKGNTTKRKKQPLFAER